MNEQSENVESADQPLFDKDVLLQAFDNDWDFFKEVIDMFVADYPQMMTDIQKAIKNGDAAVLQRTAHALKGMLGNFQVDAAVQKAYALEKIGTDDSLENAQETYDALSVDLDRLEGMFVEISEEEMN